VHCGYRLNESNDTAYGMPQINPLSGAQSGQDAPSPLSMASLHDSLGQDAPTPVSSLLAGLPRPRVSSAPSPLSSTADPFFLQQAPDRAESPSARSTVMGMPVLSRMEADMLSKPIAAPEPQSVPSPAIQSLDNFDIDAPAPAPAASAPDRADSPLLTAKVAQPRSATGARAATPAPSAAEKPILPGPVVETTRATAPEATAQGGGSTWVVVVLAIAAIAGAAWFFLR
jgi:hypothetical protein